MQADEVVATTTAGRVRGLIDPSGNGTTLAFLGVPFAAPPVAARAGCGARGRRAVDRRV